MACVMMLPTHHPPTHRRGTWPAAAPARHGGPHPYCRPYASTTYNTVRCTACQSDAAVIGPSLGCHTPGTPGHRCPVRGRSETVKVYAVWMKIWFYRVWQAGDANSLQTFQECRSCTVWSIGRACSSRFGTITAGLHSDEYEPCTVYSGF